MLKCNYEDYYPYILNTIKMITFKYIKIKHFIAYIT